MENKNKKKSLLRIPYFFSPFETPFDQQVNDILSTTPSQALRSDFQQIGRDVHKSIRAYAEKTGKTTGKSSQKQSAS